MKTRINIRYVAFALFAFTCFALSAKAQVNCQEGCDLNGGGTTVLGDSALIYNMGGNNTAVGSAALVDNIFGSDNTAIGEQALQSNDDGNNNTAIGVQALFYNSTGSGNTATGVDALVNNTEGTSNTADGMEALFYNSTGGNNTATGYLALFENTGDNNTANGVSALLNNTTGHDNTAEGFSVLQNNTTGSSNIAIGSNAGLNLTTGSNNIDIGNAGVAGESARIRIGTRQTHRNTFIAGISGVTVPTGIAVLIDNTGHLGTATSSARFKDEIKPMDKASEAILALKPVTFRYKQELDPEATPQFGLVAEDVEKVNPDLVVRDEKGKPYSVRYEQVNAMLLNEFLKEHKAFVQEQRNVEKLEATVANLIATVKEQTAQIQKVSAQLELSRPAPQTVLNSQ